MIKFDPTITLSGILTAFMIIGFGWKIIKHMNRMEFKVDMMWSDFRKRFSISNSLADDPPSD